jgi:hypothetical protein
MYPLGQDDIAWCRNREQFRLPLEFWRGWSWIGFQSSNRFAGCQGGRHRRHTGIGRGRIVRLACFILTACFITANIPRLKRGLRTTSGRLARTIIPVKVRTVGTIGGVRRGPEVKPDWFSCASSDQHVRPLRALVSLMSFLGG